MKDKGDIMAFKMEANTTQISNIFIDDYMPKAQPAFVLVYLYAYRQIASGNSALSNGDIANALHMLEGDVAKAWEYWIEQKLVCRHEDGALEFLTVQKPAPPTPKRTMLALERQPEYSPHELSLYLENSNEVKELFNMGQTHLGKLLSQNDMSILFGFYDWLRLPLEVIEVLLVYCVKNNHRSLRYIEKVALTWAEEGIDSPQKAMDYIRVRSSGHKEVMKAFGISGRALHPTEDGFVKKWMGEYNMPLDVIVIACEKTVLQTGKISFPYADSILSKWSDSNIRTKEAVLEQEKQFQEAGKAKKVQQQEAATQRVASGKPATVKQSRFVNYEQRQWDFEELARLERERLKQNSRQPIDKQ